MDLLPLIIDIILVLIFVSCVFEGRKKGFVKTVLSLLATIISIIIAQEYASPVAEWFNGEFIHDRGVEWLTNLISENINNGSAYVLEMIPESIIRAAEPANVSVESLINGIGSSAEIAQIAEQIYSAAETVMIKVVITAIAFLVIYAIANAILSIAVSFISGFFKLPVLKSLNKLFGGVLGAIKGVIAVCVFGVVLVIASELFAGTPFDEAVSQANIPGLVWETIITLF